MANDCDCKIRISGEPDNVKRLYDKLQINEVIKKGSLNLDNYELLFESVGDVEDWGSKWQVFSNIEYYHGDNSMLIEGYSAWNPNPQHHLPIRITIHSYLNLKNLF